MNILNFIKLNWGWIIIILLILFVLIRTKVRGFFWRKRKTNEELSVKEFFRLWKKGIEGISPLQIARSQVMGTWIIITGIISGIIVNALVRMKDVWWWVLIVLSGSLIVTGMSLISSIQKYLRLKEIDKTIKELENDNV